MNKSNGFRKIALVNLMGYFTEGAETKGAEAGPRPSSGGTAENLLRIIFSNSPAESAAQAIQPRCYRLIPNQNLPIGQPADTPVFAR